MIKRFAPIALLVAAACGGGGDGGGVGPKGTASDISTMSVGEVRVLNAGDIPNGITLPAVSDNRDYVIIVGNTNSALEAAANYTVKADRSPTGTFGIEVAADLAAQTSRPLDQVPLARTRQQVIDSRLRSFERASLRLRSRNGMVASSRLSVRRSVQAVASPVPAVGDRINVNIPDMNGSDLCTDFFSTQAVVGSVSKHAILAVDTLDLQGGALPPSALFSQTELDAITQEFDNVTYPTDSSYFGKPTDIDSNQRVVLLFSGEINKLTPPQTDGGFVAGFFFAGDMFPVTDQGGGPFTFCPGSNEGEIFYLLSPDPTGQFGNVRQTDDVRQGTRGTIAHEFQHMINSGNRLFNSAVEEFEATWLDEALSHVAEDAVGRVSRGFGDLQTLTFQDVLPCNTPCSQANDFNAFFYQNFARLTYWMKDPDQYAPFMKMADTSLAVRGAAWAIVRFAADNYSNGDPRAFTRKLDAGPDTGTKNFSTAAKTPIDTLVKHWLVSMYADHLNISGLDPSYQYKTYNFRSIMPPVAKAVLNQSTSSYPLFVQSIGSGSDNLSGKNHPGSGTYYRLTATGGAGTKTVRVVDAQGNNASFVGEKIYVLRVQ